jgi:hypothetical protein
MGFKDDNFKITPLAIDINDTRSLHVASRNSRPSPRSSMN